MLGMELLSLLSSFPESLIILLLVVGLCVLARYFICLFIALYEILLLRCVDLKKYGEWVVITGATDGIGKAYVFEMARRGLNICIISRTRSKLLNVKEEMSSQGLRVQVKIVVCDFNYFDAEMRDTISNELEGLDVAVLINNVGISYPFTQYFTELSDKSVKQLVDLNVNSTTWMTRIVLPSMEKKQKGLILNISSFAGHGASPLLSQYSAAKAYIEKFSLSLHAELKGKGIQVQSQIPFYVVSKLSKVKKPSLMVPTPDQFVQSSVRYLGRGPIANPWWPHRLQGWLLQCLPNFLRNHLIFSAHMAIRKKALRKLARETTTIENPLHGPQSNSYGST